MHAQIRDWLVYQGFPEDIEIVTMRTGLGSTSLWRVSASPQATPMVVRVFPESADATASREYAAMRATARAGVPVPVVVTQGSIDGCPALVTTFARGVPVTQALGQHPDQAHALGVKMGQALGRLHEVQAPDEMLAKGDAWIDKGGSSLAPLRPILSDVPNQDRLLHLDFHPNNVLVEDGEVTAIIDWENTLAGPPHMDLARTRAILWAVKAGDLYPKEQHGVFDQLEQGIVDGHVGMVGTDPHAELSAAWGLSMTADDLAGQLGKPESWVTEAVLARLRREGAARIAALASR